MNYKLLCIDLDGTLLNNDSTISCENSIALKMASQEGVEIAITTGRLFQSAKNYLDMLNLNCHIIASNGSYILHKDRKTILSEKILTHEQIALINDVTNKYNLKFYCNSLDEVFVEDNIENEENQEIDYNNNIMHIKCNSLYETIANGNKKIFRATAIENGNFSKLMEAKEYLKKSTNLHIVNSMPNNFDIMQNGVSKGSAVQILSNYLNINQSEVICVGDRENDISMIKYAGLGVAMGNATNELKCEADYITDNNYNNGVAKVIHKFILKNGLYQI